ncbi:MFS transporter [Chromobacterium subtsugae]|uniref:MFS transporter n=1 Tax=Chromobacterium subtsugae TaxID=251747 RepID=A0ABS7FDB6_9NEIS|nr:MULTISPECIES: MFS transporter [Chromobacterium]KUM04919.1 MFS transporter [Chromobacterium subtsugae]KZE86965.1 MFS transporter [Chromobacterium sp. F49]MBW7566770.1 MFS transporter [Chromobacterium subtsugae]MBW8288075.1 MFS transporter [Chromobacterium subtsugae]WSE92757.1 MFS transporter [Chromobacterium subtsugae]
MPDRDIQNPPIADELLIDDDAPPATSLPASRGSALLLLLGLVLVGLNLRPALSSLAPVLAMVSRDTGLTPALAGLLTTLPVACLGLFGPLAPHLARRLGSEKTIALVLALLAAGIALRTQLGVFGLFAGSALAGAGIGVIGVLLPGIVKRDFASRAGLMTGVYTMALCLGAALAAGFTVPVAEHFGRDWRPALALWALPALLAIAVWWPQLKTRHAAAAGQWQVRGLLRDPLAWQVTLFMGLQSSLAYIVFGWLPSILMDRGLSAMEGGLMLSLSTMVQVPASLLVPMLAHRCRNQRPPIAITLLAVIAGLLGMLYAPTGSLLLWAILLGFGQGGLFSTALSLLAHRSPDQHVAAHLSGMAQGIGYMLASLGPFAVGVIRGHSHAAWPLAMLFCLIAAAALTVGMLAGRKRLVGVRAVAV